MILHPAKKIATPSVPQSSLNRTEAFPRKKLHFSDFSFDELDKELGDLVEPYRLRQICQWIFERRAASFETMSNLPVDLRKNLDGKYSIRALAVSRRERSRTDRTVKFTFKTEKEEPFSAVFLSHEKYNSICISTQVGCAWKCSFCASGLVPFQRNLSSGEILDQIFLVEKETRQKIHNVLFMGMGEPLSNYAATVKTIRWLTSAHGFKMNPARITLSTTGLAPQIKKIADEKLKVNLALSLHAGNDPLRKKIMPVSSRFPVHEVLEACKIYQVQNGSDFTIEYILLKNVNDHLKDAEQLSHLIHSMHFSPLPKINLIPYNPVHSIRYQPPEPLQVQTFFEMLKSKKFNVHTRKPQGQDIEAACGQLL